MIIQATHSTDKVSSEATLEQGVFVVCPTYSH